ncbi:MAG TPA: amidohydrolase family protein [Acidimicrobiales bacterium]|nr:amidohydrolase family protein [Acidimicrobiales bacterium]
MTRLAHPVIDSDGHLIECYALVRDHISELAGSSTAEEFDRVLNGGRAILAIPPGTERRAQGRHRTAWWGLPTRNTLDRATAMFPRLMYERLDELGIDVAVLYPTGGLTVTAYPNDELRRVMARAFNRYYAEAYADYRDRLIPVAAIPCFTPDEAVAELEYAVGELGLKAVMLAGVIARPFPGHESSPARWIDTLGHDSPYDYEPVWDACERLGVAATFHAAGMGWGSRTSTTNYVYNHIGNFAAAGEATARSLLFGGVPRRHPGLRFAFQEGGIALASSLFADVLGHFAKRNRDAVRHYDPSLLDRALLGELADTYGVGPRERLDYGLNMLCEPEDDAALIDEFAASGIERAADVVDVFTRQYHFGCEADDPMNALAFDRRVQPHGVALRALFASDIGHWDVPDAREVLPEALELVERGLLSEDDFRAFTFGNAVSLWAGGNPAFFDGTVVEAEARRELASVAVRA